MTDSERGLSRRAMLRVGGLAGIGALAGCTGDDSGGNETTTTVEPDSVFESVHVEGKHLVCLLPDDHDVSRVNLIAPNGTRFTTARVPIGVTRVELEIIHFDQRGGRYRHYTPGIHKIVAIIDEKNVTQEVELRHDLRIVGVSQYRAREYASHYGKIAVELKNVGTAPTWVWDLVFRDAPNNTTIDEMEYDPGLPRLTSPRSPNELILRPSESQKYVSYSEPLIFDEEEAKQCTGEFNFTVVGVPAKGEPVSQEIHAVAAGEAKSPMFSDQHACTSVSVELPDGESE